MTDCISKIDPKQKENEQREQLRLAWNAHFRAADVTEIRALRVPTGRGRPATVSGYFNNVDAFIEAAMSLNRRKAEGIYFIPNEIDASLLSRRANRLEDYADATTADHDVKAYRRILIDVDPVRPKGISSSEAELRAAQGVMGAAAEKMAEWFSCGKPATVATSGNGWHLEYCVDAANTPKVTAAIKTLLAALAKECDTEAAKVDTGNFNPSRIWKLPGTFARKGDSTPDRPHRLARLIQVEESPYVISESAILEFAAPRITTPAAAAAPATRTTQPGRAIPPGIGESADTLAAYLLEKGVNVKSRKEIAGGGVALLVDCIIAPEHGNNCTDTAVIWRPNAPIGYECKHSRCSDATWLQFREKLDPGYKTAGRLEIGDIDHGGGNGNGKAPPASKATANTPATTAYRPVIVRMSDVQRETVDPLWPGRFYIGKTSLISGNPGLGKSFFTIDLASRVSTGNGYPDAPGVRYEPGNVVMLNAEDGLADTIRPRLDAAGADVSRVFTIEAVEHNGERDLLSLDRDIDILEQALEGIGDVRFVSIDPVSAYLGKTDSHNNAEVRGIMARLAALAEKHRFCLVLISHLRKAEGKAIHSTIGSIAFVAAARSAWAVTRDKADPDGRRRLLLPMKNNLAADTDGLAFSLCGNPGETPHIQWETDAVKTDIDDAMAGNKQQPSTADSVEFLRELLAGGPMKGDEVKAQAKAADLAWSSVKTAKEGIVKVYRQGYGKDGGWYWRLRGTEAQR